MPDGTRVDAARAAAERDELGEWVADFLASPGSDNAALADEARRAGPLLARPGAGAVRPAAPPGRPAGDPVLETWDEDDWRDDVEDLAEKVEEGWEPPPVVASYRDGQLVLEDGNHRVEGMRRSGEDETWVVIGFADPEERDRFTVPSAS